MATEKAPPINSGCFFVREGYVNHGLEPSRRVSLARTVINQVKPMSKKKSASQIQPLATQYGLCLASKMITQDGAPVGYMYREEKEDEADSGWRFFSGEEDEAYIENARNFALIDVNRIANIDQTIIPLLDSPVGSEFDKIEGSDEFVDSSD